MTDNIFSEDKRVTARSDREVQEWRREKAVQVFGRDVPRAVTSFDEANFPSYINAEIKRAGFTEPSPIQCQSWPMALSGRDLVVGFRAVMSKLLQSILKICLSLSRPFLPPVRERPLHLLYPP
jgi:ATP-dependent RNA helicase DDX5/DBP2